MVSRSGHGIRNGGQDVTRGSIIIVDADGGRNCKRVQDTIENTGVDHSFILTHGPFCGHEENGKWSHDQNDGNFIEWVNGLTNNPVEAVFFGHTHEPWICYGATKNEHDGEEIMWAKEKSHDLWTWHKFYFSDDTWYIESDDL